MRDALELCPSLNSIVVNGADVDLEVVYGMSGDL